MKKPLNGEGPFEQGFHGPNLGYVIELYERYLEDPSSIDPEMKEYFEKMVPLLRVKERRKWLHQQISQ